MYFHLIFSTKGRRAFLQDSAMRAAMHAYLGGIAKQLDC
jgi:putative transposase